MTRCKLQLWCRRELHTDRAFGCAPRHGLVINPCPFPSHQSSSSQFDPFWRKKSSPVSRHFLEYEILELLFFVLTCEDDQDLEASSNLGVWFGFTTISMTKVIPCYTELCRVIHLWSFENSFALGFSLKLCKRPSGSTSRRKKERRSGACCLEGRQDIAGIKIEHSKSSVPTGNRT